MSKHFSQRTQGIFLVFMAAFLWSTIGAFFKALHISAPTFLFFRSLIATLTLYIILRVVAKQHFLWPKSIIDFTIPISYSITMIFFIFANELTTAANAVFLQYISPFIVFVLSVIFLQEKIKKVTVISLVLSMIGIGLFFIEKGTIGEFWGNVLGISAGVSLGVYTVLLAYKKSDQSISLILLGHIVTVFFMAPFVTQFSFSLAQWSMLIYLGCFQIALAAFLYNKSLQKLPAQEVSLFALLEPVLNPLWALMFIHEVPSLYSLVGGIVILSALVIKIASKD